MENNTIYLTSRKIAIIITVLVLVLGSLVYFSTDIAKRNNEMEYKKIYGENVTINDIDNTATETVQNVKTALV